MTGVQTCALPIYSAPADDGLEKAGGSVKPHRLYNIGNHRSEHLMKVVALLEAECGRKAEIDFQPMQPGDVPRTYADIAAISHRTNPAEVMRTRLLLEPEVARLAALNVSPAQIAEMQNCLKKSREAASWRQYEALDNRLHRVIAEATQNNLLLSLLDTLNAVRRAVAWSRPRTNPVKPDPDHHSFSEHEAIVGAIVERDMGRAAAGMRKHLESVERNLLRASFNGG